MAPPRKPRPNYRHWFTGAHLEPPSLGALAGDSEHPITTHDFDDYYKPSVLSHMEKIYAFEMTSTLKFTSHRNKNGVSSPFETLTAVDSVSSPTRTPESRRTSRRWAGGPTSPSHEEEDSPSFKLAAEDAPTHVVQTLVSNLLDPPRADLDNRQREYEWYMHYQEDELLAAESTAEPLDLQVYVRAAQMAAGEQVEDSAPAAPGPGVPPAIRAAYLAADAVKDEHYEPPHSTVQFYENWTHLGIASAQR